MLSEFKSSEYRIVIPEAEAFLRPAKPVESDATAMASWRNDAYQQFFTWIKPSANQVLNWLRTYQPLENDIIFLIQTDVGELFGQVSLYDIDFEKKIGELGRIVRRHDKRCKGLMTKSCRAVLNWAFRELGLQNIHLDVFAHNVEAINLYSRLGFTVEKRLNAFKVVKENGTITWALERYGTSDRNRKKTECRPVYCMVLAASNYMLC